jgi:hypothetical protein
MSDKNNYRTGGGLCDCCQSPPNALMSETLKLPATGTLDYKTMTVAFTASFLHGLAADVVVMRKDFVVPLLVMVAGVISTRMVRLVTRFGLART